MNFNGIAAIMRAADHVKRNTKRTLKNPIGHLKAQLGALADQIKEHERSTDKDDILKNPIVEGFIPIGGAGMFNQAPAWLRKNLASQIAEVRQAGLASKKAQEFHGDTKYSLWPGKPEPHLLEELPGPRLRSGTRLTDIQNPTPHPAGNVIEAQKFFDQFPSIRSTNTQLGLSPKTRGSIASDNSFMKAFGPEVDDIEKVIAHEFTHGAQHSQGLPIGTDPEWLKPFIEKMQRLGMVYKPKGATQLIDKAELDELAYTLYRYHAGESMATAAQNRAHLNSAQRQARLPLLDATIDGKVIHPDLQIVRYNVGAVPEDALEQMAHTLALARAKKAHALSPKAELERELRKIQTWLQVGGNRVNP
jgi:hypothetical protein